MAPSVFFFETHEENVGKVVNSPFSAMPMVAIVVPC